MKEVEYHAKRDNSDSRQGGSPMIPAEAIGWILPPGHSSESCQFCTSGWDVAFCQNECDSTGCCSRRNFSTISSAAWNLTWRLVFSVRAATLRAASNKHFANRSRWGLQNWSPSKSSQRLPRSVSYGAQRTGSQLQCPSKGCH